MDWLVIGTRGGKSGRWKLEAADESAARQKAVAGGVAVQEVRRYPVAQATAVAPAAVEPSGVHPATMDEPAAEPEVSDDEPPVDPGGSGRAGSELMASDEDPSGEASAALTPAPDEIQEVPAKSGKSTRSNAPKKAGGRKKSVWGIAAIVAGVVAAVASLIAAARVASLPLGILGLLLAGLGIYFSLKRKRAGMLLPIVGVIVCAAATTLVVYTWFQNRNHSHAIPTAQELEDQARAARVAQANIHVQFVSMRAVEGGKYAITFAYNCGASGMMVTRLDGKLRISDASSGQEIESLTILGESFAPGLGTDPVKREDTWALQAATVQALQGDASRLKVEFDPFLVN